MIWSRVNWFKLMAIYKQVKMLKVKISLINCYVLDRYHSNTPLALKLSRSKLTPNQIWLNKTHSPQQCTKDHKTQWDLMLHLPNQVQEETGSTMHCLIQHSMNNSVTLMVFNINENIVIDMLIIKSCKAH